MTREQAAALAGLAPYDDDSGEQVGTRHIEGGRQRLRRALYAAALAASFRWNKQLISLYQRLIAAGKGHTRARCLRPEDTYLRQHDRGPRDSVAGRPTRDSCPNNRIASRFFVRPKAAFLRPDLPLLTTPRAAAVKDGRRSLLPVLRSCQAMP